MNEITHVYNRIPLLIGVLVLAACSAQTPIQVFVTPTPASESTPPAAGDTADDDAARALRVSQQSAEDFQAAQPRPTVTFMGPIVGPDYTPPPTPTPRPSATPPPTEPPTPGPSPTALRSATPRSGGPGPIPDLNPQLIGIQVHPMIERTAWNEMMRRAEQLQVGWIKIQIDWALLQPNGPLDIGVDFRRTETYVEDAKRRGFNVLLSVAKAPNWARSVQVESGPPDNPQVLADFLTLMLRSFGIVDAIEIWNEPNLAREWRSPQGPSGAAYMALFRAAHGAIRAYSPNVAVVTAGLAPTGDSDGSVDDRRFLQQMYNAGLGQFNDIVVGVHPFGWGNPPDVRCCNAVEGQGWDDDPHFFFAHTIDEYRAILNNNGHDGIAMWATEFGWATWDEFPGPAPEVWMTYTDKWAQGNNTLRAFEIGQSRGDIGPMFLWNLNWGILPGMIENRDERAAYSLLTPLHPLERPTFWMLFDAVQPDLQLDRYD